MQYFSPQSQTMQTGNVDRFVISYSQFDSRPVFFFIFRRIQAKLPEISETRFAITAGAIEINSPGHRQFFLYYFLQMISLENTKTNRFGRERIGTITFLASLIVKVMLQCEREGKTELNTNFIVNLLIAPDVSFDELGLSK